VINPNPTIEQIREGRQMLLRIEMQASRCWADALTTTHERGLPRDVPFGERAWYDTLLTIRDLKRGRALRRSQRNPCQAV
jgi:hypothetical protein